MTRALAADYLVIGSGAMGMAFTDVLLTETDASIIMIDNRHQPGGHWNHAYPFVRLHQPSSFYGVNSRHLGNDTIDQTGWNQGLFELATGDEVCAYFDSVMQQQFLPTGRLEYLPMCEYLGDSQARSLSSGERFEITAQKIVDSTYMNVTVPSMRKPPFDVAPDATVITPNGLPLVADKFSQFTVLGAGKTGMDACLWLLRNGIEPDRIGWVMPRDSWLLNRANIQPGDAFRETITLGFAEQLEALATARSLTDLFVKLQDCGQLMRIDDKVWPTMYRCATVTLAELAQLRRISDVIRLGHVERIEAQRIRFRNGERPTTVSTLHIDCSADGLERRPVLPVFDGNRITLQPVRTCQQVFSAAFIGHVESTRTDVHTKNDLCTVIPHPDSHIDWLRTTLTNTLNQARWAEDKELRAWLINSRLDGFSGISSFIGTDDANNQALRERIEASALPALARAQSLLQEYEASLVG